MKKSDIIPLYSIPVLNPIGELEFRLSLRTIARRKNSNFCDSQLSSESLLALSSQEIVRGQKQTTHDSGNVPQIDKQKGRETCVRLISPFSPVT